MPEASDIGRSLTDDESATYHFHVGAVMRAWAHLEFTLLFYLQILLDADQFRARIVWDSLPNFRARRNLIGRLAETFVSDAAVRVDFQKIMVRMKKLAKNRNALAHSIGGNVDSRSRIVFLVDGGDERGPFRFAERRRVQVNSIRQWHEEMQALRSEMGVFLRERLAPSLQASPRKPPGQHSDQT